MSKFLLRLSILHYIIMIIELLKISRLIFLYKLSIIETYVYLHFYKNVDRLNDGKVEDFQETSDTKNVFAVPSLQLHVQS